MPNAAPQNSAAWSRSFVWQSMMNPESLLLCTTSSRFACLTRKTHEISTYHGTRAGYRAIAPLLPRRSRTARIIAPGLLPGPLHAGFPGGARRRQRPGRTPSQLGPRTLCRRPQLRPPGLRRRRRLCRLSALDGPRRHDQPAAARWPHGLRAFAGQHLDRAAAEGRGTGAGGTLDHHAECRRLVAIAAAARDQNISDASGALISTGVREGMWSPVIISA